MSTPDVPSYIGAQSGTTTRSQRRKKLKRTPVSGPLKVSTPPKRRSRKDKEDENPFDEEDGTWTMSPVDDEGEDDWD